MVRKHLQVVLLGRQDKQIHLLSRHSVDAWNLSIPLLIVVWLLRMVSSVLPIIW